MTWVAKLAGATLVVLVGTANPSGGRAENVPSPCGPEWTPRPEWTEVQRFDQLMNHMTCLMNRTVDRDAALDQRRAQLRKIERHERTAATERNARRTAMGRLTLRDGYGAPQAARVLGLTETPTGLLGLDTSRHKGIGRCASYSAKRYAEFARDGHAAVRAAGVTRGNARELKRAIENAQKPITIAPPSPGESGASATPVTIGEPNAGEADDLRTATTAANAGTIGRLAADSDVHARLATKRAATERQRPHRTGMPSVAIGATGERGHSIGPTRMTCQNPSAAQQRAQTRLLTAVSRNPGEFGYSPVQKGRPKCSGSGQVIPSQTRMSQVWRKTQCTLGNVGYRGFSCELVCSGSEQDGGGGCAWELRGPCSAATTTALPKFSAAWKEERYEACWNEPISKSAPLPNHLKPRCEDSVTRSRRAQEGGADLTVTVWSPTADEYREETEANVRERDASWSKATRLLPELERTMANATAVLDKQWNRHPIMLKRERDSRTCRAEIIRTCATDRQGMVGGPLLSDTPAQSDNPPQCVKRTACTER